MFNAIHFYRLGHFCFRYHIPLVPFLMKFLIRLVYNSAVDCQTEIGKGTFLAYGGIGVVIHKRVVIGKNVTIGQQVTIGGKSGKYGVPVIGDNVYLGAGAKILGDIRLGNGVIVGANSVVLHDVPDHCVVAGVPAKVIKRGGDETI
jgi:serine O-acetyltransferase